MYNWGYIKTVSLHKLDLDEKEAQVQHLLERFPYYANEAMTQICSSVKPKYTFAKIIANWAKGQIHTNETSAVKLNKLLDESFGLIAKVDDIILIYRNNIVYTYYCISEKTENTISQWATDNTHTAVGVPCNMPDDFISFGDDISYQLVKDKDKLVKLDLFDVDYEYHSNNEVIFKHPGEFYISYNARWFDFVKNANVIDDTVLITAPNDVVDCIPSYIVSQCYKIDDEYKASVFRNEYEIFLSRIDNTNYKNTSTILIGGDW